MTSSHLISRWPGNSKFKLTIVHGMGLSLLIGTVLPLFLISIEVDCLRTATLFLAVTFLGLTLCQATREKLGDPRLRLLGILWLIKLGLMVFLLYAGWLPQLNPDTSENWGYDPQRYYSQALELIDNHWAPTASINYQGIIYYYGAILYLFGRNPIVPALVNSLVTLLGTLYLIRIAYVLKASRTSRDWTLAYLLLIPEVVWYDAMTSRETLAAVLVLVFCLTAGGHIVGPLRASLTSSVALVLLSLIGLLAIRTSMAMSAVMTVFLMLIILGSSQVLTVRKIFSRFLFPLISLFVLTYGPIIQYWLGGYAVDYSDLLASTQSFEDNIASQMEWSSNSLGLLLAPSNAWQAILFAVPRSVLYLLAPLPNVWVSPSDLLDGKWSAWQKVMTVASSVLNLVVMPYVLAGSVCSFKMRRSAPGLLVFPLSFWINLLVIAGANIIIHERYRLMISALLLTTAWLGYVSASRQQIRFGKVAWYGLIVGGLAVYLAIKFE